MSKKKFLSFFIFLGFFYSLSAQIQIEDQRIEHRIKLGDTFYSISRLYSISLEELKKANPDIKEESLKEGDLLKIPSKEGNKLHDPSFITYKVKPKETLYGLSKYFDISIDELKKINPSIKDYLAEGSQILIPKDKIKNKDRSSNEDTVEKKGGINFLKQSLEGNPDKDFFTYLVEKADTVFSILKSYDISLEELLLYNPNLEKGLKTAMTLKIPSRAYLKERDKDNVINVVLMVPLFSHRYKNEMSPMDEKIKKEGYSFFMGVKQAIEAIKVKKNIALKVFDTENNKEKIDNFLTTYNFSLIDIIIGPLFRSELEIVASHLKKYEIPIISPLSASSLLDPYPNIIQAEVKDRYLLDPLIEEIKSSTFKANKIYLLGSWEKQFLSYLKEQLLKTNKEIIPIKDLALFPYEDKDPFFIILPKDEQSHVMVSYIKMMEKFPVNQAYPLAMGHNELYYQNKNILKKYKFSFSAKNYLNIKNEEQKRTLLELNKVHAPSHKHVLLGYDLTYDVLNRVDKKEKKFLLKNFPNHVYKGLGSKYHYKKIAYNKGYENKGVWMIRFKP